jgi:hypothetical protein
LSALLYAEVEARISRRTWSGCLSTNCIAARPPVEKPQEVHLAETQLVDQAVGVLYDVLRLQIVLRETARAPTAASEVEEDDVVVASQGLEAGEQVAVADVRAAVHDDQRRLAGPLTELADEQGDVADVHELLHAGSIPELADSQACTCPSPKSLTFTRTRQPLTR